MAEVKKKYKVVEGKHRDEDGKVLVAGDEIFLTDAELAKFPNKFAPVAVQVVEDKEEKEPAKSAAPSAPAAAPAAPAADKK